MDPSAESELPGISTKPTLRILPLQKYETTNGEDNIFIAIPLNDKSEYAVTWDMIKEWKNLYPKVDIEQALRNIRGWNLSHVRERKTKNGILKHMTSWLAREQDKGGATYGNGNGNQDSGNGKRKDIGAAGLAKSDSAPYPVDHVF
jgi:hypothetical protein